MSRILPILFNTEMVRAILDGRKTVTRRIVKKCNINDGQEINKNLQGQFEIYNITSRCGIPQGIIFRPPYQPGDILYVRETYCPDYFDFVTQYGNRHGYKADYDVAILSSDIARPEKWTPSIHMPKEAARIWLKVTDVRVERLQEITEEQAKAEGIREYTKDGKLYKYAVTDEWWIEFHREHRKYRKLFAGNWWQDMPRTAKDAFKYIWDSTVKNRDKYGWYSNPWVWVIEFERCEKPGGM